MTVSANNTVQQTIGSVILWRVYNPLTPRYKAPIFHVQCRDVEGMRLILINTVFQLYGVAGEKFTFPLSFCVNQINPSVMVISNIQINSRCATLNRGPSQFPLSHSLSCKRLDSTDFRTTESL